MSAVKDYALVVGVDHYTRAPFEQLGGAVGDAKDFVNWLETKAGVPRTNIDPFLVLSEQGKDVPSLVLLWRKVRELYGLADPATGRIGRRLYLFFAGHGVSPDDMDEAGLVTLDADDVLMPYLPGKECADFFVKVGAFDEVVLFMDCCRISAILLNPCSLPLTYKTRTGRGQRFVAFGSALNEVARETTVDGTTRGVFSRYLMEALNLGGDATGKLTTATVRSHLEMRMKQTVANDQWFTFPIADPITLLENLPVAETNLTIELRTPAQRIEILDGRLTLVRLTDSLGKTQVIERVAIGSEYVVKAYDGATVRKDTVGAYSPQVTLSI